jgi:ketosteroid isomerase-like protein
VHPFHPLGAAPLTSRAELRGHFTVPEGASPVPRRTVENVVIHETVDPEVIVAEFEYHGDAIDTGERVVVPGIFVMRVRDGLIVSSRDYLDHLASARFRGQLGEVLDAVRERHA